MIKNVIKSILLLAIVASFTACGDDDKKENLTLNITGLEDLGDGYAYEGWLIVDGSPVTTGVFNVNESGVLSKTTFEVDKEDLDAAATFVLTIEPSPDSDPDPASTHILAGTFSGSSATLSVGHDAALADDFASAAGGYILATPTDGMDTNENSGVWFLDPSAGPGPSLTLPTLPAGWAYEGWAVIDGIPVTTGTFTSVSGADDASPFSDGGPAFPGEDFLMNAPSGLTFPTDVRGGAVVISVEPVPDNSPNPFTLKPLLSMTAADAMDHSLITMGNNSGATNPKGSATR